jgi:hypothetical protein
MFSEDHVEVNFQINACSGDSGSVASAGLGWPRWAPLNHSHGTTRQELDGGKRLAAQTTNSEESIPSWLVVRNSWFG